MSNAAVLDENGNFWFIMKRDTTANPAQGNNVLNRLFKIANVKDLAGGSNINWSGRPDWSAASTTVYDYDSIANVGDGRQFADIAYLSTDAIEGSSQSYLAALSKQAVLAITLCLLGLCVVCRMVDKGACY